MSAFDTGSVTFIRKTGDRFKEGEIKTAPVEECEGVGGGDATMRELEQLLIYEVIDSSVKLNRLNL